jgi:hypothetical protein
MLKFKAMTLREDLFEIMNRTIMNTIEMQRKQETEMLPLNAIWMEKDIRTAREVKRRITHKDLVKIEKGSLVDCDDAPTHEIIELHGTAYNTKFSITVKDLKDGSVQTVSL